MGLTKTYEQPFNKFQLILKLSGFTPEHSKIDKNRKWKKHFDLVETTLCSPAFLQNSSQINPETYPSREYPQMVCPPKGLCQ